MFTAIGFFGPQALPEPYNYWDPSDYPVDTVFYQWDCKITGARARVGGGGTQPTKLTSPDAVGVINASPQRAVFDMFTTQDGAEYINGEFGVFNQTWVMWTKITSSSYVEWFGNTSAGANNNFNLRVGFHNGGNFGISRQFYGAGAGVSGGDIAYSNTSGSTGVWTFTALSCGSIANQKKFYYNGLQMENTISQSFNFNGGTLTNLFDIGFGWAQPNYTGTAGSLGPFRIYPTQLTSAQIFDLYNSEKTQFGL